MIKDIVKHKYFYKALNITITSLLFLSFVFTFYSENTSHNNPIYSIFVISVFFSLPMLISKVIFRAGYISKFTLLSYLYYPLVYLIFFIIKSSSTIKPEIIISSFSFYTVLVWFLLFTYSNIKDTKEESVNKSKAFLLIVSTIILLTVVYTLSGRSINSIVANDYLVHNSAINQMLINNSICVIPSQCSNLFLIDTYTTFYHTFVFPLTTGFNINYIHFGYVLDIVFSAFIGLYIFNLLKKFELNNFYAVAGTLLSIMTFEQGAFTYQLFIPQTFAFFLTLNLFLEEKHNRLSIIGGVIIFLVHFVMGAYSLMFFAIYSIFKNKIFEKKFKIINTNSFIIYTFIIFLIILLLSIGGFSLEKSFQTAELENLGGPTNYYFPDNIKAIFEIFGLNLAILVISAIYLYIKKLHTFSTHYSIFYILTVLGVFLLAPIYANKFLIGIGIFAIYIILEGLYELILDNRIKLGIFILIVLIGVTNFMTRYNFFTIFYQQENNITSAISPKDLALIDHIKKTDEECIYISDPQTQLTISALTTKITDRGSYSSLQSRRILSDIVRKPSISTLSRVFEIETVGNKDVCFIYTARLKELTQDTTNLWLNKIYYYIVDFSKELTEDEVIGIFNSLNLRPLYRDNNSVVYKVSDPI